MEGEKWWKYVVNVCCKIHQLKSLSWSLIISHRRWKNKEKKKQNFPFHSTLGAIKPLFKI
jgi:hypothetical protein